MSIYNHCIEEIHSFDARYKNVIFRNNNIVVPYINLGVSKHPLHTEEKGMAFLDYTYMVFVDVSYLKVYLKKPYIVIDLEKKAEHFYFGGDYWDNENKIFNDMEIGCSEAFLQTLNITKLSDEMWMPLKTPNFTQNMNSETVEDFFNHNYIPPNINALIS